MKSVILPMSPTFLVLAIALFIVWTLLILLSRATRYEQLVMSLFGLIVSPAIILLAARTGTSGSRIVGMEDFLFAFSFFGVASVVYEAFFGKHFIHAHNKRNVKYPLLAWGSRLSLALGIWTLLSVLELFIFHLSLPRAMVSAALLVAVYVIAERKDLLTNALVSGVFMAALIFLCEEFFIVRLYPPLAASGGMALSPDLILWSAVVGFAIGPLYEYVRRMKMKGS